VTAAPDLVGSNGCIPQHEPRWSTEQQQFGGVAGPEGNLEGPRVIEEAMLHQQTPAVRMEPHDPPGGGLGTSTSLVQDLDSVVDVELPASTAKSHGKVRVRIQEIKLLVESAEPVEGRAPKCHRTRVNGECRPEVPGNYPLQLLFEGLPKRKTKRRRLRRGGPRGIPCAIDEMEAEGSESGALGKSRSNRSEDIAERRRVTVEQKDHIPAGPPHADVHAAHVPMVGGIGNQGYPGRKSILDRLARGVVDDHHFDSPVALESTHALHTSDGVIGGIVVGDDNADRGA